MTNTALEATRTIEVCLSRDHSVFSWFTYFLDGGGLTHASVAFDEDSDHYYSFNFKGFKREYKTSLKRRPRDMKYYKILVTEEQYQELKRIITDMESRRGEYHYSKLGAAMCLLKIPGKLPGREDHMFCSEFVAKVLDESGCVHIKKAYGKVSPNMLGKEIEQSGKVTGISYDEVLEPVQDTVIDKGLEKLNQGKEYVVQFSMKNLENAKKGPSFVSPLVMKIGVKTADRCETIFRSAASLTLRSKEFAGNLPGMLAEKTGELVQKGSDKISGLFGRFG